MGQSLSFTLVQIMGCITISSKQLLDPHAIGTKTIVNNKEMRDTTIAKHGHEGIINVKVIRRNLRLIPLSCPLPFQISIGLWSVSHSGLLVQTTEGTERIVEHAGFVAGVNNGIVVSTVEDIIMVNANHTAKNHRIKWRNITGAMQAVGENYTGITTLEELIVHMEQHQERYHILTKNCHRYQGDARRWLRKRDRNEEMVHKRDKGIILFGGGGGAAAVGVEG